MKKNLYFLTMVMLIIAFITSTVFADDVIKIGIAEPMTGSNAVVGQLAIEGYELAREHKPTVLGKKVEFVLVDNKSDKVEAANAAARLVERDKVKAILAGSASSLVLAAAEITEKAKIPLVTSNATHPLVTQDKEFVWRACFVDTFLGEVMARYVFENLGIKETAFLVDVAQDYAVGLATFFRSAYEKMGGEIVVDVKCNTGDQDFSAQLSQIIASGAEALFLPGYFGDSALIIAQARELGYTGYCLGGDSLHNPVVIDLIGDAAEGIIAGSFFAPDAPATPESAEFSEFFIEKYKEEPNAVAILCYDSYNLLIDAIERANSDDPVAINEALAVTTNFPGAGGTITYHNKVGDAIKPAVVVKVQNGTWVYEATIEPN